jgi:hypothetical protein
LTSNFRQNDPRGAVSAKAVVSVKGKTVGGRQGASCGLRSGVASFVGVSLCPEGSSLRRATSI